MVEEGLEKGICALESGGFIFNCCFGEFSVCIPSCDGEGLSPPRGGLGVHKEPSIQEMVPLGVTWCKGQYFGDNAHVFLETKTCLA